MIDLFNPATLKQSPRLGAFYFTVNRPAIPKWLLALVRLLSCASTVIARSVLADSNQPESSQLSTSADRLFLAESGCYELGYGLIGQCLSDQV